MHRQCGSATDCKNCRRFKAGWILSDVPRRQPLSFVLRYSRKTTFHSFTCQKLAFVFSQNSRLLARALSNGRVRMFRNAIAHANWSYRGDFNAIVYWARKGADPQENLERFEVAQEELSFWQSLSRCVAYAAFSNF